MTTSFRRTVPARRGLRILSITLLGTSLATLAATWAGSDAAESGDGVQAEHPVAVDASPHAQPSVDAAQHGGGLGIPAATEGGRAGSSTTDDRAAEAKVIPEEGMGDDAEGDGKVVPPVKQMRRVTPASVRSTSTMRRPPSEHRPRPASRSGSSVAEARAVAPAWRPSGKTEMATPRGAGPASDAPLRSKKGRRRRLEKAKTASRHPPFAPQVARNELTANGMSNDDRSRHERAQHQKPRRRSASVPAATAVVDRRAERAQQWKRHMIDVAEDSKSTFSIDVDTAAYARARSRIRAGELPNWAEIRVEEMINYFDYDYASPGGDTPIAVHTELGPCPWNGENKLVHVGLQARQVQPADVPARNLVFLLDVSGSMGSPGRLPLLKRALSLIVPDLRESDRVSIVVYAGAAGAVLEPTSGADGAEILMALDRLESGGSTNGGQGIELAYALARKHLVPGGINRVILATDGDFNVGVTDRNALVDLVVRERGTGVYLSVLGFGVGQSQDVAMEQLADKGNGNYAYIDSLAEAHKVLVEEGGSTIVPAADDVKIQVEFNDVVVASYRLVGYDNRRLAHRDFANDQKDAGEMGSGHTVTALYEVVPRRAGAESLSGSGLDADAEPWLMTVNVRYKRPGERESQLLQGRVTDRDVALSTTSDAFRFSAAVAEFGQLLSGYDFPSGGFPQVVRMAQNARQRDSRCHRAGFVDLATAAAVLAGHAEFASRSKTECTVARQAPSAFTTSSRVEPSPKRDAEPETMEVDPQLLLPAMRLHHPGEGVDETFSPLSLVASVLETLASALRMVPTGVSVTLALVGTMLLGVSRRSGGA